MECHILQLVTFHNNIYIVHTPRYPSLRVGDGVGGGEIKAPITSSPLVPPPISYVLHISLVAAALSQST